jgi:hypothetical protein
MGIGIVRNRESLVPTLRNVEESCAITIPDSRFPIPLFGQESGVRRSLVRVRGLVTTLVAT